MTTSTVAVQLYSVRDAIAADLRSALQRIAELGLHQVEPFDFVARAGEYAALLPELGLTAPSAHGDLLAEDPAAAFRAAKRMGVGTAILPWTAPERWTTRSDVEAVADELNALRGAATDAGVRLGYHNHWFELAEVDGVPALEVFADRLDPGIVLELDTYWTAVGGVDTVGLLGRLGDRVRFLHIKDGPATRETRLQVSAGRGSLDVAGILAAAPSALRVIEFDDFDGDVFEGIRGSIEFLVGTGETL